MEGVIPESYKTQSPKSYLYTTIAKNHLGEVAAIVISCLISHGRLTSREIGHKTKLPIKVVKSALVSLVQLQCVYYWKDDNSSQSHYNFNENGILNFLHSGEIINHIKTIYGDDYAEIIQNVLVNGHIKISDYMKNIEDEQTKLDTETIFLRLFTDKWLARLQLFDFHPFADIWNNIFQDILKKTPRSATTSEIKRVTEAKEKTKVAFTNLLEGGQTAKELYITTDGYKRLNPNLIVRFNLSRFKKHIRSEALANLAKSRVGVLSAKIYEIALGLVEQESPDIKHPFLQISGLINDPDEEKFFINSIENKLVEDKKIVFTVRELQRSLPADLDLRNSILTHNFLKPNLSKKRVATNESPESPNKKIKLENGDDDDDDLIAIFNAKNSETIEDDNSDFHSISLIQHHLKLLSNGSSIQFLIETTPGTFTIPYTALIKSLQQYNFETLIKTTLGVNSFRVLRCLKSQKIGDEKSLANAVLLKEKTVRNEVYKLFKANLVEIQEVPRSADRAASKTFFLFRHKEIVSYNFLNNALIFSMAEILTNIQNFKEDHKILLEKCEREDVKGHEDELLLESELKTLKNLQTREIQNIGRFYRIKSLFEIYSL
ncbi:DNA-directed RNA polymerase III subunit RPC3 [Scheffersomyces coipomensis]|uniref:DNA-directed RNA polymerase III subunit RPC3 n=1 Tax=Scheffersomyces coipomensis TaxID=1788519 RepID=UPI00315C591C